MDDIAELKNKILDQENEIAQMKEVLPQAFAALEVLAGEIVSVGTLNADVSREHFMNVDQKVGQLAERTLKWLQQFRVEGKKGENPSSTSVESP